MITKLEAILSINPEAECVVRGDVIEWLSDGISQPTDSEIQEEITRLQSEYDGLTYARTRKKEYPSIGDQLDALFHAGAFPADMAAQIQAVKDAHPKPVA